jgi:hypothetical protein
MKLGPQNAKMHELDLRGEAPHGPSTRALSLARLGPRRSLNLSPILRPPPLTQKVDLLLTLIQYVHITMV